MFTTRTLHWTAIIGTTMTQHKSYLGTAQLQQLLKITTVIEVGPVKEFDSTSCLISATQQIKQ